MAGERTIRVTILGDATGARSAMSSLESGAEGLSVKLDGLGAHLSKLGDVARSAITRLSFAVANAALGKLSEFAGAAKESIIGTNAALEQGAVSWSVLLGGADAANAKIQQLYQFAATTPFEFNEVQQASLLLQTFGGDLLNTSQTLGIVGDVASGTNQSFQEVAFWAGRMYSAMQSGQPFGEAAARMQEMGAISGDTLVQLQAMQKAGASGSEMWDVFTASLGRFNGMMVAQSNTFNGRLGTMHDTLNMFLATAGKPIFDRASASLQRMIDLLSSPRAQQIAVDIAKGLGEAYDLLDSVLGAVVRQAVRLLPPLGLVRDTIITMNQAAHGNWFGGQTESINLVTRSLGRFVQLGRDAVLTFTQAFRGNWAGQATTSINGVVRLFGILGDHIGRVARNARDLFTGREGIADFIGRMFSDRGDLLNKLGHLVTDSIFPAVGEVVAGFRAWWQRSDITGRLGGFLTDRFNDLVTFIRTDVSPWASNIISGLGDWLQQHGAALWTALGDKIGDVGGFVLSLGDKIVKWVQDNQGPLTTKLGDAGRTLGGLIVAAIGGTGAAGSGGFGGLADVFKGALAGLFALKKEDIEGQGAMDVLKLGGIAFGKELINGIGEGILSLVPSIDDFFTNLFNQDGTAGSRFGAVVGSNLGGQVRAALADLVVRLGKLADLLLIIFENLGTNIGLFIEKGLIQGMIDGTKNMLDQMPDWLKSLLHIPSSNDLGFQIAQNFVNGIQPVPLLTPDQIKYFQSIFAPPSPVDVRPGQGFTEGQLRGQPIVINNTFNGLTVPEVVQQIGDGLATTLAGGGGGSGLLMP